ncbi:MAG: polysaccharide export protein [bacterium]|nr:polysaccharide export protein [bacterium]
MKKLKFIIMALLFCGSSFAADMQVPPGVAKTDKSKTVSGGDLNHIIKPRDVLEISVWRHENLNTVQEVSPSGEINMPLLGEIKVRDMTVYELKKHIEKLYADGYIKNPYVTVIVQAKTFFVMGEIKRPGNYTLLGKINILSAITMAGGFTDFADKGKVKIIRGTDRETLVVNVARLIKHDEDADKYMIGPGDVINVPQSFW